MPGKIYEELLNQAITAPNFDDKVQHKCLMCKNLLEFALEINDNFMVKSMEEVAMRLYDNYVSGHIQDDARIEGYTHDLQFISLTQNSFHECAECGQKMEWGIKFDFKDDDYKIRRYGLYHLGCIPGRFFKGGKNPFLNDTKLHDLVLRKLISDYRRGWYW